jgi:DNA-directed RNA polymerase specialized sigma24 family protein
VFGARTEGLPVGADGDERIPSQKPNPLEILLAKESVHPCLRKLAVPDRELLESYYLDENTVRIDLAQSQGLSIDGLRTRIHRIMNRVRECARKQVAKQKT